MSQTTDYWMLVFGSRGDSQLNSTITRLSQNFGRLETSSDRSLRAMQSGDAWMRRGAASAKIMASELERYLQKAGEVSRVEAGYRTVLKSEAAVQKLSRAVRQLDVDSPWGFLETARGSQTLLASGFRDIKEHMRVMYDFSDATVAAGKDVHTYLRALQAVGRIKMQGKLYRSNINQLVAAGIPDIKQILQKKLKISDKDWPRLGHLNLKSEDVIPALLEGIEERFSGGMKKAANQYLGAKDTFEGSRDKLEAAVGKTFEKDATAVYKRLTELTNATSDFVSQHPRLTKTALAMGVIATGAMTVYGAYTKFRGARDFLRGVTGAHTAATAAANAGAVAADRAARAVTRDSLAEAKKTRVAKAEAAARHAAAAAAEHQTAANTALMMTGGASMIPILPGRALPMLPSAAGGLPALPAAGGAATGAGAAAGAATAGIGSRMGAFWRTFLSGVQARWAGSKIGAMISGILNKPLVGTRNYAAMMEDINMASTRMGRFWLRTSVGNGLAAGATGAAVGWGIYDSLSNPTGRSAMKSQFGVDVGEGGATAIGAGAGIAVGAAALAAPQIVVPLLVAVATLKAIELGINKLYLEPGEKRVAAGNGADNKALYGAGTNDRLREAEKAAALHPTRANYKNLQDIYNEMAKKDAQRGDEGEQDMMSHNAMAAYYARMRDKAERPGTAEYDIAQYQASINATSEKDKEGKIAAFIRNRRAPGAGAVYPVGGMRDPELEAQQAENERMNRRQMTSRERAAVQAVVSPEMRGGGNEITIKVSIPDRQADAQARRRRSNTMTPAPVY